MKKLVLLLLLCFSLVTLCYVRATYADTPYVDIKANDSDGHVMVGNNENLSISIAIQPSSLNGVNADWWILVCTLWNDWFYYVFPNHWGHAGSDMDNIYCAYQGHLFDLPSVEIVNFTSLPVGIYTFYFGIDTSANGILDGYIYYDSVTVNRGCSYSIQGLDVSPYIDNDDDPTRGGSQITEEELRQRIGMVAPYTKWIRTYGCNEDLKEAGMLAHSMGLKSAVGIWLSSDKTENEKQIKCLVDRYKEGYVDLAVVGSEVLLRGDLDESELINYINRVKADVSAIPVAYADVYSVFLSHPKLIDAVDVLLVNYFPFWEGIDLKEALYSLNIHHKEVVSISKGKPVMVSETGWPSEGEQIGKAVPSVENAAFYFLNFVSWARANNVDYFYFEAFDEPWKAESEGPQGAHWGIWDRYGKIKPGMESVFEGKTMGDNWSNPVSCGPGEPSIQFTYVPPVGSFENLKGKVCHVGTDDYKVAVYIYVSGWWTKPYWDDPFIYIDPSGEWECDITTGDNDESATKIAAYLLPKDYDPPLMHGEETLSQELKKHAVAHVEVKR